MSQSVVMCNLRDEKYKERDHSIKFVDIHLNLMKLRAVYLATLCNVKLLISARICVKKVITSRMKNIWK